jgi:hypothetical protein
MTVTFITYGKVVSLFKLTPIGLHWVERNRMQALIKGILKTAYDQTKRELADYIQTYWPLKTGALISNTVMYVWRNAWYDLNETATATIGSDVFYLKYLITMKERFGTVHWTNPRTVQIEDDIIGHTYDYLARRLIANLDKYLASWNLGWLYGRGRPPTKLLLAYDETTKGRKAWERTVYYYGHEKPLEVLV